MSSLSCAYEGSSFPGGRTNKRGFHDLWPRSESEEVVLHALSLLGFSDAADAGRRSNERRLFSAFSALPALDLRSSDYRLIQAYALFSKSDDMDAGIDKRRVALESFRQSEVDCKSVNERLSDLDFTRRKDVSCILYTAMSYIGGVLGACPSLSDLECNFGPGSSASTKKMKTTARWKLSSEITISTSAFSSFERLRACYPLWLGSEEFSLLGSSKPIPVVGSLDFVPKSFKTYRSVIIEPLLNTFVQKGIGSHIKHRLKYAGLDLSDQSVQRERARLGSIDGSYSTIDLSRASDSISYRLVFELLNNEWFELLDTWRTPMVSHGKEVFTLEKFSSMGNGFTFELETLIFKALVRGIAAYCGLTDDSICYGDDITCNTELGLAVTHYLPLFGFAVNEDKSFLTGPFREACGGDYRDGTDIRPFFLRGIRTGGRITFAKLVSFHNFLTRKPWFDVGRKLRDYILTLIPNKSKCWGPDGYGDIWLLSLAPMRTYLPRASTLRGKEGWDGFAATGYVTIPPRDVTPVRGDAILPAYLAGKGPQIDVFAVRAPKSARLRARKMRVIVGGPAFTQDRLMAFDDAPEGSADSSAESVVISQTPE